MYRVRYDLMLKRLEQQTLLHASVARFCRLVLEGTIELLHKTDEVRTARSSYAAGLGTMFESVVVPDGRGRGPSRRSSVG